MFNIISIKAKKKIGEAKTSSAEAKKIVDKALEDVNAVIKELSNLVDVG